MAMSRSFGGTRLTTLPPMLISPWLISSRPASMRSSVDLPQPEGPTSTVNSPSAMSKPMPWMIFAEPKLFWTSRNETEAIARSGGLALHRAGRQARHHVALERVVDRGWRQRIDEPGGHQQFPRRVVGREKAAEGDAERRALVVRQEQEGVEI